MAEEQRQAAIVNTHYDFDELMKTMQGLELLRVRYVLDAQQTDEWTLHVLGDAQPSLEIVLPVEEVGAQAAPTAAPEDPLTNATPEPEPEVGVLDYAAEEYTPSAEHMPPYGLGVEMHSRVTK